MGKAKKKIINWVEYNKALCKRDLVTFWIDDSAIDAWKCKPIMASEVEVLSTLIQGLKPPWWLRGGFSLPLRALQGFIDSIMELLDVPLTTLFVKLTLSTQQSVEARLRDDILTSIKQCRDDLSGRKACELRALHSSIIASRSSCESLLAGSGLRHIGLLSAWTYLADTSDDTFSSQFELHGKLALNYTCLASLRG